MKAKSDFNYLISPFELIIRLKIIRDRYQKFHFKLEENGLSEGRHKTGISITDNTSRYALIMLQ